VNVPKYDYGCIDCGARFERERSMAEANEPAFCPVRASSALRARLFCSSVSQDHFFTWQPAVATRAMAVSGRPAKVRQAAATLAAPSRRSRVIAGLRQAAPTWGAALVRTALRSSSKVTSEDGHAGQRQHRLERMPLPAGAADVGNLGEHLDQRRGLSTGHALRR
jgi:putative FmdB family regulatory protein